MLNTSSKKSNLPIKIGLTGGIGSGKSLVANIFKVLKVPLFVSDTEAKIIMNSDIEVRNSLISVFGKSLYGPEGNLNRKYLADIIFNNREMLGEVNKIVHPAVRQRFDDWWTKQTSPYVLQEAAILFESGTYTRLDYTILIISPQKLRIERVMQRDNITRDEVMERINNQWPDKKKMELADFIIQNDGKNFLIEQVLNIHNKILSYGTIC